jgi:hypothetical protein
MTTPQAGSPHALLTIRSSIGEESLPVFPAAAETIGNRAHLGKFNRQVWGVSLRYQHKRIKRVALRCEKTDENFGSFVTLALSFILIKSVHTT